MAEKYPGRIWYFEDARTRAFRIDSVRRATPLNRVDVAVRTHIFAGTVIDGAMPVSRPVQATVGLQLFGVDRRSPFDVPGDDPIPGVLAHIKNEHREEPLVQRQMRPMQEGTRAGVDVMLAVLAEVRTIALQALELAERAARRAFDFGATVAYRHDVLQARLVIVPSLSPRMWGLRCGVSI